MGYANIVHNTILCLSCKTNFMSCQKTCVNCKNCGLTVIYNSTYVKLVDYIYHIEELHRQGCTTEPFCKIVLNKFIMLECSKCNFYDTLGIVVNFSFKK